MKLMPLPVISQIPSFPVAPISVPSIRPESAPTGEDVESETTNPRQPLVSAASLFETFKGTVHRKTVDLNNVVAEAYRSGFQDLSAVQLGDAFSGAKVGNTETQSVTLDQDATSINDLDVAVPDPTLSGPVKGLLDAKLTTVKLKNFFSRAGLDLVQRGAASQGGNAVGKDATGGPSEVTNTLSQEALVRQKAEAVLDADIDARRDPFAEAAARFRGTLIDVDGFGAYAHTARRVELQSDSAGNAREGRVENTLDQSFDAVQDASASTDITIDASVEGGERFAPGTSFVLVDVNGRAAENSEPNQSTFEVENSREAEASVDEEGEVTNTVNEDLRHEASRNAHSTLNIFV